MSEMTTGTPEAIASSGGSPKPSASNDGNSRTSHAWYQIGITSTGSASP